VAKRIDDAFARENAVRRDELVERLRQSGHAACRC
jgi:hypothetical protein